MIGSGAPASRASLEQSVSSVKFWVRCLLVEVRETSRDPSQPCALPGFEIDTRIDNRHHPACGDLPPSLKSKMGVRMNARDSTLYRRG